MTNESKGRDLFIVDNSVSGWSGLRYLGDWTGIAKAFDIATGFFEIGALLELDGKWQSLEKIRILMGAEMTHRTKKALLDAVTKLATDKLDKSIDLNKSQNPFLKGVPAILEALKSGKIECRVYDKDKFHAKAYITHAKMDVIGSQALVGSSNFTKPGLTDNIELNIQVQSAREVNQLQEWYEIHWAEGKDVSEAIIQTIERHARLYSPFEVYAKALQEFFRGHELTDTEWDETRSKMFPNLDRYQKEAYWALMKISRQHGGAFLCDGVGLGKTFVGLMLIERLVLHEGKRVVLFAPKGAKEGVWEPHLREWLGHIGGVGGGGDFSNLVVFSHTDLNRKGDFPERFKRITELADAVIIDEAHHFRNPGMRGNEESGKEPSRYYRLFDLLDSSSRSKSLFMLTATPINNALSDFRYLAELFTRKDDSYFARTMGINSLKGHFISLEKILRNKVGHDLVDLAEDMTDVQDVLASDQIFQHLVVQRSRAYARASQMREKGNAVSFPERKAPQVAEYSIKKTYGKLLDLFETAFKRSNPLFTLPMYYPLAWYIGDDITVDAFEENRQKQIVGLIRTNFLKRFESSVVSFEMSCNRLMRKMLAFVEVHVESEVDKKRLERWKAEHAKILGFVSQKEIDLWGGADESEEEDVVPQEFIDAVDKLDRTKYKVDEMVAEAFLDLDQIVHFIHEVSKFEAKHDDKLQKLIRLLKTKELEGQKVLIFTEFADTARYLERELRKAGIEGVEEIDSGTKGNRRDVIERFAPYYNRSSSAQLFQSGRKEIRILISTDVLSEGLNLQDASRMINYDIHWNPVRLMQRIGRVDRRMSPDTEKRLIAEHPEIAASRGKVSFWNFLPPDELNSLLTLYSKVTQKTLLISKTLGIEGKKLLTPDDDFNALKDFNHSYEGTKTIIEDMNLEYQSLISSDLSLEAKLKAFPNSIYSGRKQGVKELRGVFLCYALPALDKESGEFTENAGSTRWYLYDLAKQEILDEPGEIIRSIRAEESTPRICSMEEESLVEIRQKVEKHIKNTYMKRIDAPVDVKAKLKCWMELNEG
jgi:superfamily II DNA or RNA helicase